MPFPRETYMYLILKNKRLFSSTGLAYDWLSKNLYWTDNTYKWIRMSSTDGRYQTTIVEDNLAEPLGIVVHPQRGLVLTQILH